MMDNVSTADLLAMRDGNGMNGFGNGGGDFLLLVLFLFMFGQNGFGNGYGNAATAASQQEILYGQQFQNVHSKLDDIGKGICNSTYDLNNSIKDCCCNTQLGIAHLGAQIDQQTCAITTAIHGEADATRAMMRENEIQSLRDKVNDLQRDAALCGVVRYPMGMMYASNCNPFCGPQNGCGYGCGNNGF